MASRRRGVGTIIKETLAAWGITDRNGCGCKELAAKMNKAGPDNIERELDNYVSLTEQSIEKWRGRIKFLVPQPPRIAVEALIKYGITQCRLEQV